MQLFNAIFFLILFFISWLLLVYFELFIDFLLVFTMSLQTKGRINWRSDQLMDGSLDRQTYPPIQINRSNWQWWFYNRFCHFYKSFMDRRTNRLADQRSYTPSYGDALAISNNKKILYVKCARSSISWWLLTWFASIWT